jgi:membrane protease YdiL (CAAX protease family)
MAADKREGWVPWRVTDVAWALLIPGLFFALNVIAGLAVDAENEDYSEAELISTLAISMGFQVFLLVLVWWFGLRKYGASWRELGLRMPVRGGFFFPLALVFSAFAVILPYGWLLSLLGVEPEGGVPSETFDYTSTVVLVGVLILCFAPMVEEMFFRGFVFGGLRGPYGVPVAIALSGLVFGLAHAGAPESFYNVPPIAAIGALFAWGYFYTGSLYASIGAHFLFNLSVFAVELA